MTTLTPAELAAVVRQRMAALILERERVSAAIAELERVLSLLHQQPAPPAPEVGRSQET